MTAPLEYDLLVAGGGSAGSAAAVAAARRGHRVLLVEEQNCLGGVSTAGGVGEWFAETNGLGDIFQSAVWGLEQRGVRRDRFFNPEYLKFVWQELAEAAGVRLLFHSSICLAKTDDGYLKQVQAVGCSKFIPIQAKFFIDASGEGDLAALAGADFQQGDPESGRTLHMSLTAWLYDTGKKVAHYLPPAVKPIDSMDELPGLGLAIMVENNRLYLNATKVMGCDPTDPFSLSDAECETRRQLARILEFAQRTRFPTHALGGTGATIGIREGRRIVGDYYLTQDQILDRSLPLDFPDGIAVATSQIDFHSLTDPGSAGWRQKVEPYAIPFRCLIAKGFRNLLMAGKCISVDQVVQSSCRMTPTCCAMGQAAGTAVALALENKVPDIRQVSTAELRATLAAEGIIMTPDKHKAFAPHDTRLPS